MDPLVVGADAGHTDLCSCIPAPEMDGEILVADPELKSDECSRERAVQTLIPRIAQAKEPWSDPSSRAGAARCAGVHLGS